MRLPTYDLAIVGAGILGLSHAAAASALGLRTLVLEASPHGAIEASARNFGLLTQLYDAPGAWGARASRSRSLYASWAREEPTLPLAAAF